MQFYYPTLTKLVQYPSSLPNLTQQIITSKDNTIKTLRDNLSTTNRVAQSSANVSDVLFNTQAELDAAKVKVTQTEERLTAAVRAERSIASHRVATLESKHKVALQREKDAIVALTSLSQSKLNVEKDKAREHVLSLDRERMAKKAAEREHNKVLSVERKSIKTTEREHKKAIDELRIKSNSEQRLQRKELNGLVSAKNASITSLTKQVTKHVKVSACQAESEAKASALIQRNLKRLSGERDRVKGLASKRLKRIEDKDEEVDSVRDHLEEALEKLLALREVQSKFDIAQEKVVALTNLTGNLQKELAATQAEMDRVLTEKNEELEVSTIIILTYQQLPMYPHTFLWQCIAENETPSTWQDGPGQGRSRVE